MELQPARYSSVARRNTSSQGNVRDAALSKVYAWSCLTSAVAYSRTRAWLLTLRMLSYLFPTVFVGLLGHRLQLDPGIREHDGVALTFKSSGVLPPTS